MHSSSSFIDDLSPREKRYDLEIDPNLFISVLPNGAKTWVLCDMVLGKPRRKTLGVYPEMSLSEARDAVERVASVGEHPQPLAVPERPRTPKSDTAPPTLTVRDGRIVPAGSPRWPLMAAAGAAFAVIAGGAYFWQSSNGERNAAQEAQRERLPAAARPSAVVGDAPAVPDEIAQPPAVRDSAPDPAKELLPTPVADSTEQESGSTQDPDSDTALTADASEPPQLAGADQAPGVAAAMLPTAERPSAVAESAEAAAPASAEDAAVAPPLATTSNSEQLQGPSDRVSQAVADTVSAEMAEPQSPPLPAAQETSADAPREALAASPPASDTPSDAESPSPAGASPAEDTAAAQAPAANDVASPLSAGAVADIPQTPAPARGVARYQLTSDIRAREPTDDLGATVNGGGADIWRVYFFTDLRGLDGETVTHRWLYNGTTSATVSFDVGGWRWRVYSSKDLLLGQGGDWRVEVLDEAGKVLASHAFTYTP